MFLLKINVTLESFFFHGAVSQLKINLTLESWCFSLVSVQVDDQYDVVKFVFFMG